MIDVLLAAMGATLGTLWFILGALLVIYGAPGRFHL